MERETKKAHLEFDWDSARKTYVNFDKELSGQLVTSPYDLYAVERLRDIHDLRKGIPAPVDVFVFGKGTPKNRYVTKISGLPYWQKKRLWPQDREGKPMQFLAQINFQDSKDIIEGLPGDILAVFVPQDSEDWLWETDRILLEWVGVDENELIDVLPPGVKPYSQSEWYGVIHRTYDYADAHKEACNLDVSESYVLAVSSGTKIGGDYLITPDVAVDPETGNATVLPLKDNGKITICQIASIQAHPDTPYPWTNQEAPLLLKFDESGIYHEKNSQIYMDMGSLYIEVDSAGNFSVRIDSY